MAVVAGEVLEDVGLVGVGACRKAGSGLRVVGLVEAEEECPKDVAVAAALGVECLVEAARRMWWVGGPGIVTEEHH